MIKKLTNKDINFSKWYNEIINKSKIAEISDVRGSMILKPYGYSIWENIKSILDNEFKKTGHQNVYFPLLIPKSFFSREANHIEGFAKECAVVTHYRLKFNSNNKKIEIDKDSKLDEELIIRPTSETMVWNCYSKWIQSYKDLPLLLNQWANVVRWEMRTRMFLRTTEILWQEGHTAHATKDEAIEETLKMLNIYSDFIKNYLAIPVIIGKKTENEKFAGADITYTLELLTQEKKALQAGTSHFLGTNFSKAFNVKFLNKENKLNYVWGSSWGITTRLIGALIMAHSDNNGLVLPPKIAPLQVVIIPIFKKDSRVNSQILEEAERINNLLLENNILSKIDKRTDIRPGWKFTEYEIQGVPIRISLGSKEVNSNSLEIYRRDNFSKTTISKDDIISSIIKTLTDIQSFLYQKALKFQEENTKKVDNYENFKKIMKNNKGFIIANWDGTKETEKLIKDETKATIRCILDSTPNDQSTCIRSQKKSKYKAIFAEAY